MAITILCLSFTKGVSEVLQILETKVGHFFWDILYYVVNIFLFSSLLSKTHLRLVKYVNMPPNQYSTYLKYIWYTYVNCSVIKSSLFLSVIWYSIASKFIIMEPSIMDTTWKQVPKFKYTLVNGQAIQLYNEHRNRS